jgi:hypothetical protein
VDLSGLHKPKQGIPEGSFPSSPNQPSRRTQHRM